MFWLLYGEDTEFGDITSETVISKDMVAEAMVIAKEKCVLAGAEYVADNLRELGLSAEHLPDGSEINSGMEVMHITGNAREILKAERTILNILGRMSGIALQTRKIVDMVHKVNPQLRIAATRKTLWGYLDKVAVAIGGGDTHRLHLGDMVMIKDNHIALAGLEEAIRKAKSVSFTKKIEVEVENEEDALKAAELGVNIILLDNMEPENVCRLAKKLKKYGVIIEVSGGITPENIMAYAKCDVDVISMGYLTHSVHSINFTMEMKKKD